MTSNNNNKSDKKNYEPILYIINNAEEKDFNDKNGGSTTRARRDIGIQDITGIFQEKKEISIYDFIALAIKEIGKFTLDYIVSNLQEGDQFKKTFKPINELLNIQKSVNDSFPDLSSLAKELIKKSIKEKKNIEIDPDKVYVHQFPDLALSSGDDLGISMRTIGDISKGAYTGFSHTGSLRCWTLTDFLFRRFDEGVFDKLVPSHLNSVYGLYKDGKSAKSYDEHNEIKITPTELKDIMSEIDFPSKVKNQYDNFWKTHKEDVCTLARINFVTNAKKALYNGILSYHDYEMVMISAVPKIPLEETVDDLSTLKLNATPIKSNVSIYLIDINGYNSVDILRFVDDKGKTIVYYPNENQPFRVFNDDTEMRKWIAEQGKDDDKRIKFAQHFSLYNNQDGVPIIGKTGVYNGLKKLGSGDWDYSGKNINKNNTIISNDVFQIMTENLQKKLNSDADTLIRSDSEITKDTWIDGLNMFNLLMFPVSLFSGSILVGVVTFIGVSGEIGLRIDKAIEGDTEEERNEAATSLAIDLGVILLFGVLSKLPKLKFKFLTVKFNPPQRRNGKIGYLLSPTYPISKNSNFNFSEEELVWVESLYDQKTKQIKKPIGYPLKIAEILNQERVEIVRKGFENVYNITIKIKEIVEKQTDKELRKLLDNIFPLYKHDDKDVLEFRKITNEVKNNSEEFYKKIDNRVYFANKKEDKDRSTIAEYFREYNFIVLYEDFFKRNNAACHLTILHEIMHSLKEFIIVDNYYLKDFNVRLVFKNAEILSTVNNEHLPLTLITNFELYYRGLKNIFKNPSFLTKIFNKSVDRSYEKSKIFSGNYLIKTLFKENKINLSEEELIDKLFENENTLKKATMRNADSFVIYYLRLLGKTKSFKNLNIQDTYVNMTSENVSKDFPNINEYINNVNIKRTINKMNEDRDKIKNIEPPESKCTIC